MNPKSLLKQTIKGHYQLNEVLSHSTTAYTYEALDLREHKAVILKYYLPHSASSINEEIQRAVRMQAQYRSEQSVPILDFGIHSTQGFWVAQDKQTMPHLHKYLRFDHQMTSDDVVRTIVSLCDALEPLHKEGKVHGNLKLKNVFIQLTRGVIHTKISDFAGPNLCKVHKLAGSPTTYNDPSFFTYEQAAGKELTTATDIAALGLIAYILLTKSLPFEGRSTDKILTSVIINSGRIKLKEEHIDGSTPLEKRKLCEIINQCLSKKAEQRFKSVQELKAELLSIQSWAPTVLEPPKSTAPGDLQGSLTGLTMPFQAIDESSMQALMEAQDELLVQHEKRKENAHLKQSVDHNTTAPYQRVSEVVSVQNQTGPQTLIGASSPWSLQKSAKITTLEPSHIITPPLPPESVMDSYDSLSDDSGFGMDEWQGFGDSSPDWEAETSIYIDQQSIVAESSDSLPIEASSAIASSSITADHPSIPEPFSFDAEIPSEEELDSLLQAAVEAADSISHHEQLEDDQPTYINNDFNISESLQSILDPRPTDSSLNLIQSLNDYQAIPAPFSTENSDSSDIRHAKNIYDIQTTPAELDAPRDDMLVEQTVEFSFALQSKILNEEPATSSDLELFSVPPASQMSPGQNTDEFDVAEYIPQHPSPIEDIAPVNRVVDQTVFEFDPLVDTYVEGFEVKNIFPDIPAWQSLIDLKDRPEQLAEALLKINLPLSGHLLPFSQFQLQIEGPQLEENFFTRAQAQAVPDVPKITSQQASVLQHIGTAEDIPRVSQPQVITPPKSKALQSLTQDKASRSIAWVVFFVLVTGLGIGVGMNVLSLDPLKNILKDFGIIQATPKVQVAKTKTPATPTQKQPTTPPPNETPTVPPIKKPKVSKNSVVSKTSAEQGTTDQVKPTLPNLLPIPITIVSQPSSAEVWVDGKKVGKTPYITQIKEQSLLFKVILKGYGTKNKEISRIEAQENPFPVVVLQKASKKKSGSKRTRKTQKGKRVKNPFGD